MPQQKRTTGDGIASKERVGNYEMNCTALPFEGNKTNIQVNTIFGHEYHHNHPKRFMSTD